MADLKRNMIELVKNPEEALRGGEVEMEKFWTPPFIPFSKVREAMQLASEMEKGKLTETEMIDRLIDFIVDVYGKQFTKEDVYNRIHGPDAVQVLQENIIFVAQGNESSSTKKFLAAKKG